MSEEKRRYYFYSGQAMKIENIKCSGTVSNLLEIQFKSEKHRYSEVIYGDVKVFHRAHYSGFFNALQSEWVMRQQIKYKKK